MSPARRAMHPEPGHLEEVGDRLGRLAVPVVELGTDRLEVLLGGDRRELAVGLQPQPLAGDVVVREVGVDRQLDLDVAELLRRPRP